METASSQAIGRIVAASIEAFEAECLGGSTQPPLGSLLVTLDGEPTIYASVTAIETAGIDPSRPVVPHGSADEDLQTVLRRNPHLPMLLRSSFSAAIIAHASNDGVRYSPPDLPPPLLARVRVCDVDEQRSFAESLDCLEPLLRAGESSDDTLVAFLRRASRAQGSPRSFLLAAGRRLVPLLSGEPARFAAILRRLQPES